VFTNRTQQDVTQALFAKEINLIENVQKSFKRIQGFNQLSFEDQLKKARLTTLECREITW